MHELLHERGQSRLVEKLGDLGINDIFVLDAFRRVPRHLFVDPAVADSAYTDVTLPLGYQQTLSQPSVVARSVGVIARWSSFESCARSLVLALGFRQASCAIWLIKCLRLNALHLWQLKPGSAWMRLSLRMW